MNAHAELAAGAPGRLRLLAEWRAVGELGLSVATWPCLVAQAARGDGQPVLVVPGFLASDASTFLMRRFLGRTGFDPYGWELGRNMGGLCSLHASVANRLESLHSRTGRRVSIVGWSLGGVLARGLARSHPEAVRSVVTLAAPLTRDLRTANTGALYARLAPQDMALPEDEILAADVATGPSELPCPASALYSRGDGVVNWRTCLIRETERSENIEIVGASHVGFGTNPAALLALADRLAQPEGTFTRFIPPRAFGWAYGRERRTRERATFAESGAS